MDWERQTHALLGVLSEKGLLTIDELRRGIESIPAQRYELLSYYERWAESIEGLLIEKQALTKDEIEEKVKALE
jgi:nitrile hydratase